ncbi:MAG TPA: putative glycolipid-binding domain-containing protein, partial [Streptosporangiaceae bacterium]|nr:putative glycolipid-binding domain-containing protein [Streptosporangiaceae bacterium]
MRAITWVKPRGAEFAEVSLGDTYLRAAGVAVGADPLSYRLDYELDCVEGFVTRRLAVRAQGAEWSRSLVLSRDPQGLWGIETSVEGEVDLPEPGGDPAA